MSSSAPQPPTTVTSNAGQSSTTDDAPSRPTRRNPQSSALPPQEETEEEIAKKKQAEEDRARHQTEMRKQILCIQQDSSIPAAEKAKRIQVSEQFYSFKFIELNTYSLINIIGTHDC